MSFLMTALAVAVGIVGLYLVVVGVEWVYHNFRTWR